MRAGAKKPETALPRFCAMAAERAILTPEHQPSLFATERGSFVSSLIVKNNSYARMHVHLILVSYFGICVRLCLALERVIKKGAAASGQRRCQSI